MTIKERNNTNKVKTVSLFSGAGGLAIGAIMAGAHIHICQRYDEGSLHVVFNQYRRPYRKW